MWGWASTVEGEATSIRQSGMKRLVCVTGKL